MKTRLFYAVLIGLHLLFFLLSLSIGGNKIADSWDYLYQTENIKESGSFYAWTFDDPVKPDYYTKRTPAYGLFLVLLGPWIPLVLLVQNLLSLFTWVLVFRYLVRGGLKENRAALLVLGVLILQSNTLIYANTVIAEIPFQLLILLGTLQLFYDGEKPAAIRYLWASLCFTGALLLKPVMLYFWLPFLAYALIQALRRRKLRLIWPVFLMPAAVLIWSFHNGQVTGWDHYTSIGTVNLKDYNTRLMLESVYGVDQADSVIAGINNISERIPDHAARHHFIRDTCSALIKANVPAYAKVHLKGMLAMLLDPGRFDYVQFFRIQEEENGLMYLLARGDTSGMWQTIRKQSPVVSFFFFLNLAGAAFLLLMALSGLKQLRHRTWVVLIAVAVIGYFWVLTGPVGTARYKSGILPLLVLLAGFGITSPRGTPLRY